MNLQTELILSFYTEVSVLNKEKNVYLVKHVETNNLYVKKILNTYNADVYYQLKEKGIKGIPQVFEAIEDDGTLYVIEEYIQGKTLEQLFIEHGPTTKEEVCDLILMLCPILSQLHSCEPPIIHRDIKPSNLIVTPEGTLRLIDFNAAKHYSNGEKKDTMLLGTMNFAAPEQYGFGQSDIRTDIYGLGATMNYLLTGKYPNELISDGKLHYVLDKCLKLEPENRYSNSQELMSDLLDNNNDNVKVSANKRKFLPPGLRTGPVLKNVIAVFLYLLLINLCFAPDETSFISKSSTIEYVSDSFAFLIASICTVLWLGNYLNVWSYLPGSSNNQNMFIKYLSIIGYCIIMIIAVTFLMP